MAALPSDIDVELSYLRLVCSSSLGLARQSVLLSRVDKSHFGFALTREIYNRVMSMVRLHGSLPSFYDLTLDAGLSTNARQLIKDRAPRKLKINITLIRSLQHSLNVYRQIRIMAYTAKTLAEGVEALLDVSGVDAKTSQANMNVMCERLLEESTKKLNEAMLGDTQQEKIIHYGKAANSEPVFEAMLNGKGVKLLPTGLRGYDEITGGLPSEGLFIIAATTSGGKSTICNVILQHMYSQLKLNVVKVSLEMSEEQETRRVFSNISKTPLNRFVRGALEMGEKQKVRSLFKDFNQHGEDNNCRFSVWSPLTMNRLDKILLMLRPYNYNVIAIDYISLLEDGTNKDQWAVLDQISKQCKRFSRINKCLVILLAQYDDSREKIRYSGGIKENADVVWSWTYNRKEQRESRVIEVNVTKGRDSEVFSFELMERFDIMAVQDMDRSTAASKKYPEAQFSYGTASDDEPLDADLENQETINYEHDGLY